MICGNCDGQMELTDMPNGCKRCRCVPCRINFVMSAKTYREKTVAENETEIPAVDPAPPPAVEPPAPAKRVGIVAGAFPQFGENNHD
jgi:hypothetical protein